MCSDLTTLTTAQVILRANGFDTQACAVCLQAVEHARQELFRRAIFQTDQRGWQWLHERYHRLLMHWLLQHPQLEVALQEAPAESYPNEAFSRFWHATRHSERMQDQFPSEPELLRFLKLCLNSAVLDAARKVAARRLMGWEEDQQHEPPVPEPEPPDPDFWRAVQRALPTERERLLIYLRYVEGLPPRHLVEFFPSQFPVVTLVFRLERNILDRLSRHPLLAPWRNELAISRRK
jgi:DNA-directed RNA polymerase specialized sigma24 family protein